MSSPLIIVKPVTITSAMLVSSSVPETDYTEWSAGTTYALGARVRVTSDHKVYVSAAAGNVGNPPASTLGVSWNEVGPTNRWKCLDTSNSTQTAQASSISYRLSPGQGVNALAVLNLVGGLSGRVRVIHPTLGTLYDKTHELSTLADEASYWSWCFGERTAPPQLIDLDLPGIPGCDILLDLTGTSALAVGVLLIGEQREIGEGVVQGASAELRDYSKYIENGYGDIVLKQGQFAKDIRFKVAVLREHTDDAFEYLVTLRATPCLFIGSPTMRLLTAFGFIQNVPVQMPANSVHEIDFYVKATA